MNRRFVTKSYVELEVKIPIVLWKLIMDYMVECEFYYLNYLSGDIDVVSVLDDAVDQELVHVVRWIKSAFKDAYNSRLKTLYKKVIVTDNVDMIKYFHEEEKLAMKDIIRRGVNYSILPIIKYIHQKGKIEPSNIVAEYAIKNDCSEVLDWMEGFYKIRDDSSLCITNKSPRCLEWFVVRGQMNFLELNSILKLCIDNFNLFKYLYDRGISGKLEKVMDREYYLIQFLQRDDVRGVKYIIDKDFEGILDTEKWINFIRPSGNVAIHFYYEKR